MFAVYLYCLARASDLSAIDGPGVDLEQPVNLTPFKDVVAVVSTVRLDDFRGPAAEARMRDLAWVGPRACRHEDVVEQAMRASPVVPARFATLFSTPERLAAWLEPRHGGICRALGRFAGHQEWAVTGTLDRRKAEARLWATALQRPGDLRSPSPGARYLAERRIRAGFDQELEAWLREACARIAGDLREHAVEVQVRRVAAGASGEAEAPVLNWAFLVSRGAVEHFHARVQRTNAEHAEEGLVLGLSGPWPPYSFCPPLEPEPPQ